ncbi:hypothetical protein [Phyllobacterium sp. YR531]|uniref:hypothetical protein n=1 Tax=Phyllobacterium sp. YR531 TaxID=1144343 RepID=UPI00026FBA56|nr:hypothetical protein [Phyllobacterium sp. YR531]EJN06751.1 hypothetical protein PMI41_00041 [Phyllobacterium sp. YR531]
MSICSRFFILPERESDSLRVGGIMAFGQSLVYRRRGKVSGRFNGPYDWTRLVALGVVLISLASLALTNSILGRNFVGYWPGMSSIFGGLLLSIVLTRMGRPVLYLDWIANGVVRVGLGFLLSNDSLFASTLSLVLFCSLFTTSAVLTIWIGLTLNIVNGRAWLVAQGLVGLFCVAWTIFDHFTLANIRPDVILAVDLLLHGLAIAGVGLSLRRYAQ